MENKTFINSLSKHLFWDTDVTDADLDTYPAYFIQRVLEYGNLDDWRLIKSYYGLDRIVGVCKTLRSLDPICLSFICAISHTNKEDYRCYHFKQLNPTPWNS